MKKSPRNVVVRFTGGPFDGQQRIQPISGGTPGPMGCVTDAHVAGMHGLYRPDRTVTAEPFLLVWEDVPRCDTRACNCGCGGRV